MGFHLSNDSELVKTALYYSSNLLVKAEIRVKDDTQVSGVGYERILILSLNKAPTNRHLLRTFILKASMAGPRPSVS